MSLLIFSLTSEQLQVGQIGVSTFYSLMLENSFDVAADLTPTTQQAQGLFGMASNARREAGINHTPSRMNTMKTVVIRRPRPPDAFICCWKNSGSSSLSNHRTRLLRSFEISQYKVRLFMCIALFNHAGFCMPVANAASSV